MTVPSSDLSATAREFIPGCCLPNPFAYEACEAVPSDLSATAREFIPQHSLPRSAATPSSLNSKVSNCLNFFLHCRNHSHMSTKEWKDYNWAYTHFEKCEKRFRGCQRDMRNFRERIDEGSLNPLDPEVEWKMARLSEAVDENRQSVEIWRIKCEILIGQVLARAAPPSFVEEGPERQRYHEHLRRLCNGERRRWELAQSSQQKGVRLRQRSFGYIPK